MRVNGGLDCLLASRSPTGKSGGIGEGAAKQLRMTLDGETAGIKGVTKSAGTEVWMTAASTITVSNTVGCNRVCHGYEVLVQGDEARFSASYPTGSCPFT